MKKILLLLLIIGSSVFATETNFIAGYGFSTYTLPATNSSSVSTGQLFLGFDQYYYVKKNDRLVLSTIYSQNSSNGDLAFNELEIQTAFLKKITDKQSVSVGFHMSYLLNQNIESYEMDDLGFGVNLTYEFQISDPLLFAVQFHSTSYDTAVENEVGRFINQSIRSYITVSL